MTSINITNQSLSAPLTLSDNPDCGTEGVFDGEDSCLDTLLAQNPGPELDDSWIYLREDLADYDANFEISLQENLSYFNDLWSQFLILRAETKSFLSLPKIPRDEFVRDDVEYHMSNFEFDLKRIANLHINNARAFLTSGNETAAAPHLKVARWIAIGLIDTELLNNLDEVSETKCNKLLALMALGDPENLDGDASGNAVLGLTSSASWQSGNSVESRLGVTFSDNDKSYSRFGTARFMGSSGLLYDVAEDGHRAGVFLSGNAYAGLRFLPATAAVIGTKMDLTSRYDPNGSESDTTGTSDKFVPVDDKFELVDGNSDRFDFGASGKIYSGLVFDFAPVRNGPYRLHFGLTGSLARVGVSTLDESAYATLVPEMEAFLELTLDP